MRFKNKSHLVALALIVLILASFPIITPVTSASATPPQSTDTTNQVQSSAPSPEHTTAVSASSSNNGDTDSNHTWDPPEPPEEVDITPEEYLNLWGPDRLQEGPDDVPREAGITHDDDLNATEFIEQNLETSQLEPQDVKQHWNYYNWQHAPETNEDISIQPDSSDRSSPRESGSLYIRDAYISSSAIEPATYVLEEGEEGEKDDKVLYISGEDLNYSGVADYRIVEPRDTSSRCSQRSHVGNTRITRELQSTSDSGPYLELDLHEESSVETEGITNDDTVAATARMNLPEVSTNGTLHSEYVVTANYRELEETCSCRTNDRGRLQCSFSGSWSSQTERVTANASQEVIIGNDEVAKLSYWKPSNPRIDAGSYFQLEVPDHWAGVTIDGANTIRNPQTVFTEAAPGYQEFTERPGGNSIDTDYSPVRNYFVTEGAEARVVQTDDGQGVIQVENVEGEEINQTPPTEATLPNRTYTKPSFINARTTNYVETEDISDGIEGIGIAPGQEIEVEKSQEGEVKETSLFGAYIRQGGDRDTHQLRIDIAGSDLMGIETAGHDNAQIRVESPDGVEYTDTGSGGNVFLETETLPQTVVSLETEFDNESEVQFESDQIIIEGETTTDGFLSRLFSVFLSLFITIALPVLLLVAILEKVFVGKVSLGGLLR